MRFDVITIGAATRDVFLVSDAFKLIRSDQFATGVGECVALGTKINLDTVVHSTGGGATNSAATFASLGFKAAAVCRVGDDRPSLDVIDDLKRYGVSTQYVRRVKGGATGYSTLLTEPHGERTVLVHRGVSSQFRPSDIPSAVYQTSLIYLTSLGGNLKLSASIIKQAAQKGVAVAWNPGRGELEKGCHAFRPIMPLVRVMLLNLEEAELLTGKKGVKNVISCMARPGQTLVITDGTNGSTVWDSGRLVHAGTTKVKSISKTGAGDAFGSGFVAAYIKTKNIETALAVGTLNAESVIRKFGAKAGILKKWPTKALLNKIPIKSH